jgi:hypothetical protein
MTKASRIRTTREDWPFQPWPQSRRSTIPRWEVAAASTAVWFSRTVARSWLFLLLVPMLLLGLAGVAVAHWHAGSQTSPQEGLGQLTCADHDIDELVREHRRAVRGL